MKTPAAPVLAREDRIKKRKAGEKEQAPKPSKTSNQAGPKNTAVWVSNLPPDTTLEQLAGVFSKAGVLLIGDDGEPRIKLYYDENGKFKGEALIMYFKEGSVDLAITLLDDTELEFGAGCGNMRVREAEYQHSKSNHSKKSEGRPDQPLQPTDRKKLSTEEKQRMSKRMRTLEECVDRRNSMLTLRSKLAWHSDEDSDAVESSAKSQGKPSPFNRVVVLKGMFRPEDLEKEPELLLELKDDVREEAESLGSVTSVVLYDVSTHSQSNSETRPQKEPEGVITIKFKDPTAARACLLKMDGRYFDGRKVCRCSVSADFRSRLPCSRAKNAIGDQVAELEKTMAWRKIRGWTTLQTGC